MESTPQIDNETVTEWRKRLPEVPLAVPEEGDSFRVALPRALVTGAAVALVGGGVYTLIYILIRFLHVLSSRSWVKPEELSFSAITIQLILGILSGAATILAFLVIVGWAGAKYGRLTYLRANNSTAMRIGIVLAGTGAGVMNLLLKFLARNHGLLPSSLNKGEWNEYLVPIILAAGSILGWQLLVWLASSFYCHRRRYCPRCGGLLTCTRELPLSMAMAEQVAAATGEVSPVNWPDLTNDSTEEDPERLGCTLLVYRCEGCAAGLVEGEISVECPEREKDWDVKWRWLSTVYSPEETAALEASFPRPSLWDRLLLRY